MVTLDTKLSEIRGLQARFLPKLKRLGIETVHDLLWHFPTRYEDFSHIYTIEDLIPNQEATICAEIVSIKSRNTWKRNLFLIEAELRDDTGEIRATWFNQPYIKNILQPGRRANFAGKVTVSRKTGEIYFSNPTYELISEHMTHATRHTGRIIPIYQETRGLTSKGFRFLIQPLLEHITEFPEIIPPEILNDEALPLTRDALHSIHFPETIEEALLAKRRFAFDDLFLLQLINFRERMKLAIKKAPKIPQDITFIKSILSHLPFELTESQKQSLWEIIKDLERTTPMNRLLEGDVGSGKTVIAAVAALCVAKEAHQAVFLAPTEILARQHYHTITKLFSSLGFSTLLMTGGGAHITYDAELETEIKKADAKRALESGRAKIIIGTHALIQKDIEFDSLGIVIVDEQHRFGVSQRAALEKKKGYAPHFLSMSATPIPRTLALTIFGDLDLSLITELPKNRKKIITKVVQKEDRARAYQFIRKEAEKGRQIFVICPRIEKPEETSEFSPFEMEARIIKSVKEEYEKLSHHIFPDLKVCMLHGKMKPKEKEQIMRDFSENKFHILIATSVVEVGVDIPNATVMVIEGSERFGLAQLHQFRGRVGRSEHQSYCLLFAESSGEPTKKRLAAISEAKNGFELAEHDLTLRGPGEFLGTAQTGLPDLAMKAIQNPDLVKRARELAQKTILKDPSLRKYPILTERLKRFEREVHFE